MRKLVIAEDNPFIAAMARNAIAESGYELCGVAASTSELLSLGEKHKPDLALIDVHLADGSNGIDAAIELSNRIAVGVLYTTGNPHLVLTPPAPVGTACLSKPFTGRDLVEALGIVAHMIRTGEPPPRVPPKLHMIQRDRAS